MLSQRVAGSFSATGDKRRRRRRTTHARRVGGRAGLIIGAEIPVGAGSAILSGVYFGGRKGVKRVVPPSSVCLALPCLHNILPGILALPAPEIYTTEYSRTNERSLCVAEYITADWFDSIGSSL